MAGTIPGFARVEIRLRNGEDLLRAASELTRLAGELQTVAAEHADEAALILAHHRIKATSQSLRGTK